MASIARRMARGVVTTLNTDYGDLYINKDDVGLDQVDNTSDINKPISLLQQIAIDGKIAKSSIAPTIGSGTTTVMSQKATTDAINTKAASNHNHSGVYAPAVHDHNSLYYTKGQVDSKIGSGGIVEDVRIRGGEARSFSTTTMWVAIDKKINGVWINGPSVTLKFTDSWSS